MSTIKRKNELTGQFKEASVGYSWSSFVFTFLPALFRRDWKSFLHLFFFAPLTLGGLYIIYWFKYKKIHINEWIVRGFKAILSKDEAAFRWAKIGIPLPVFGGRNHPDGLIRESIFNRNRRHIAWSLLAALISGAYIIDVFCSKPGLEGGANAKALPNSALPVSHLAQYPPEPINSSALILVKNIVIDDIVSTLLGKPSVFPELAPEKIKLNVTSLQLSQAYEANELLADEKYKSKNIIVSGKVNKVLKNPGGDALINLDGMHYAVTAQLATSALPYARLVQKSDSVKLICDVRGAHSGAVLLNGCQPLHWLAEESANAQIQKLQTWLVQGGKSPFGERPETSRSFAALYFIGTSLPSNHTCIAKVAYERCVKTLKSKKLGSDYLNRLEKSYRKWAEWLQLTPPKPSVSI